MVKRKWFVPAYDYARVRTHYVGICNNLVYVCPHIYPSYPGQNEFFSFSKAHFLKCLEWFCFTLLLYAATMVQTSRMPHFCSGMTVTDLPPIQSSIQPEKIKKWMSELNYHGESA